MTYSIKTIALGKADHWQEKQTPLENPSVHSAKLPFQEGMVIEEENNPVMSDPGREIFMVQIMEI